MALDLLAYSTIVANSKGLLDMTFTPFALSDYNKDETQTSKLSNPGFDACQWR